MNMDPTIVGLYILSVGGILHTWIWRWKRSADLERNKREYALQEMQDQLPPMRKGHLVQHQGLPVHQSEGSDTGAKKIVEDGRAGPGSRPQQQG